MRATSPGSICLAIQQPWHADSGSWALAQLLARYGWRVHVLWCSSSQDCTGVDLVREQLAGAGIVLYCVDEFEVPAIYKVPHWFTELDFQSARVWQALEEIHRRHQLELIQFPDLGGLGFRAIQAKRSGLTFQDVALIVRLEGCSQWQRDCNYRWMNHTNDLLLDFAERFAFEQADFQMSCSQYLREYARSISWKLRDDMSIVPSPIVDGGREPASASDVWPPELVFVGDLDERYGVKIFVKAVQKLADDIPITFLGKDTSLPDGKTVSSWLEERLAGRNVLFLTNLTLKETLGYLSQRGRVAVMPRVSPVAEHRVIEFARSGISFLASNLGDVPENVTDPELAEHLLFEPSARDLTRCLSVYLKAQPEQRRLWRWKARTAVRPVTSAEATHQAYLNCLSDFRQRAQAESARPQELSLVTVAIPYYNLGEFLPETLASVAAQTYPNLEVIVLDDGSTDSDSLRVFEEQKRLYPNYRFLRHDNSGVCATRNRMLTEARGELFFPLDADNVIMPRMLERLVSALCRNPEYSAMSCFRLDFRDSEDLRKGAYVESYRPVGGPYVLASISNVYGETSGLFRTQALREVGGYEDLHPEYVSEDWQIYVKLASLGFGIGVVPEHLYYYRLRGDSRYHNGNLFITHQQILNYYVDRTPELTHAERVEIWNALVSLHRLAAYNHERLCSMHQHQAKSDAWTRHLDEQARMFYAHNVNLTSLLKESEEKVQQLTRELEWAQAQMGQLRYRLIDRFNSWVKRVPLSHQVGKSLISTARSIWRKAG